MYLILESWYKTPFFYGKENYGVFFLISYVITSVMLFVQLVITLNLARDNLVTFYEEHSLQTISRTLEKMKNGVSNIVGPSKKGQEVSDSNEALESGDGPNSDNR